MTSNGNWSRMNDAQMATGKARWYLYLVRGNDGSLYTGITVDVQRRFAEHQQLGSASIEGSSAGKSAGKGAKALRGKQPLALAYQISVGNRSQAAKLEYRVKQLSKSEKEALVCGALSIDSLDEKNSL